MSGMGVAVTGVDMLVAACEAVAATVTDPATATDAAALVAAAARPNVPVVTGRLAASEVVTPTTLGAVLEWTAPYALAVHARRPWLPAAVADAEPDVLALYADRAALAWS